ncbi:MAG: Branched-chain-amino-acid aminotransferase [Phycisphaerae bacterium]|nr:Branched-chain-amino-acid aminotransferase [Phycisphaerae bacterium]
MKVWLNGKLVEEENATVSVYDHGLLYGDGVFEGIRAYNGKVFLVREHVRRLFESAHAIRMKVPYTQAQVAEYIADTLRANKLKDAYIRVVCTRGYGFMGLDPDRCTHPTFFIITTSITLYPDEWYDHGMPIVTASTIRNHPDAMSPRIKSLNYLNNILAKIEAKDAGVIEAVMLNHVGNVAECTGDNIFIVAGGELITPPIASGILVGCTRNFVMGLARKARIPVREIDITRHDLYTADECFLTGTAAEVIPVCSVDKRLIGDGKPGPITKKLMAGFARAIGRSVRKA